MVVASSSRVKCMQRARHGTNCYERVCRGHVVQHDKGDVSYLLGQAYKSQLFGTERYSVNSEERPTSGMKRTGGAPQHTEFILCFSSSALGRQVFLLVTHFDVYPELYELLESTCGISLDN